MPDLREGARNATGLARAWLEAKPESELERLDSTRKAAWQLLVAVECLVNHAEDKST